MATPAADVAADTDRTSRASASESWPEIAVVRRDAEAARAEAARASDEDPSGSRAGLHRCAPAVRAGTLCRRFAAFRASPRAAEEDRRRCAPRPALLRGGHPTAGRSLLRGRNGVPREARRLPHITCAPAPVSRRSITRCRAAMRRRAQLREMRTCFPHRSPTPWPHACGVSFGNQLQAEAIRAEMRDALCGSAASRPRAPQD